MTESTGQRREFPMRRQNKLRAILGEGEVA